MRMRRRSSRQITLVYRDVRSGRSAPINIAGRAGFLGPAITSYIDTRQFTPIFEEFELLNKINTRSVPTMCRAVFFFWRTP